MNQVSSQILNPHQVMTDPDSFLKRGWLSLALVPVDSTFTMNFMDEGDYKTFLAITPGVSRTVMSRLFHQYPSHHYPLLPAGHWLLFSKLAISVSG